MHVSSESNQVFFLPEFAPAIQSKEEKHKRHTNKQTNTLLTHQRGAKPGLTGCTSAARYSGFMLTLSPTGH